jgi:hypothetical protein
MGYLDKNEQKISESTASAFVHKYTEFLLSLIEEEKMRTLSRKKIEFLNKYNRKSVQQLVERDMTNCTHEQLAYDYLMTPEIILRRYYDKLIE